MAPDLRGLGTGPSETRHGYRKTEPPPSGGTETSHYPRPPQTGRRRVRRLDRRTFRDEDFPGPPEPEPSPTTTWTSLDRTNDFPPTSRHFDPRSDPQRRPLTQTLIRNLPSLPTRVSTPKSFLLFDPGSSPSGGYLTVVRSLRLPPTSSTPTLSTLDTDGTGLRVRPDRPKTLRIFTESVVSRQK